MGRVRMTLFDFEELRAAERGTPRVGGVSLRDARPDQWNSGRFILWLFGDDDGNLEAEPQRDAEGGDDSNPPPATTPGRPGCLTVTEEPTDYTEDSLFRGDENDMQHACALASQGCLTACNDGG
eukprot:7024766-Alexandrium_andersonii.AAC.1